MASMATAGADYDNNRVSPLPRAGALLIALLVTAAGVAPLFSRDDATGSMAPVIRLEQKIDRSNSTAESPAILYGIQVPLDARQDPQDTAPAAAETAEPAVPNSP